MCPKSKRERLRVSFSKVRGGDKTSRPNSMGVNNELCSSACYVLNFHFRYWPIEMGCLDKVRWPIEMGKMEY